MLILGTHDDSSKGLVTVREQDILYHTAVIGQSGSGKSFLIARLLEEAVLRTKARIVVIDPNGDFGHFYSVRDKGFWTSGTFADALRTIATQQSDSFDTYERFHDAWLERRFQFVTAGHPDRLPYRYPGHGCGGAFVAPLRLHWKWLEYEQDSLLDVDPMTYPKIYQGIVTCNHYVADNRSEYPRGCALEDLEDIADPFARREIAVGAYPEAFTLSEEDWLAVRIQFRRQRKRFGRLWYRGCLKGVENEPTDLSGYILRGFTQERPPWQVCIAGLAGLSVDDMWLAANLTLLRVWNSSVTAWGFAKKHQLAREIAELERGSVGGTELEDHEEDQDPDESERSNIETEVGEEKWIDQRVPTFVIIDETHNFAPESPSANPLQARVSDRIATIAAEGRKYGIFLILATQRPQKLRPGLLEECENACLLRIQSKKERERAADSLGIPPEIVERSGTLPRGNALLHGRWVPSTQTIRFAPTRTLLGGGGLDENHWRTPPP